jgi:hypothetical protein
MLCRNFAQLPLLSSIGPTRFDSIEGVAPLKVAAKTTTFRLLGCVMEATVLLAFRANLYSYR